MGQFTANMPGQVFAASWGHQKILKKRVSMPVLPKTLPTDAASLCEDSTLIPWLSSACKRVVTFEPPWNCISGTFYGGSKVTTRNNCSRAEEKGRRACYVRMCKYSTHTRVILMSMRILLAVYPPTHAYGCCKTRQLNSDTTNNLSTMIQYYICTRLLAYYAEGYALQCFLFLQQVCHIILMWMPSSMQAYDCQCNCYPFLWWEALGKWNLKLMPWAHASKWKI